MTRRIAIIPARGGSKRIPQKNIRDFCGKPMIGYILETARASGLFEVIHVSTDDERVRDVVEGLGFSIDFMRPATLADDHTPIMPVLKYVLETYATRGLHFDEVWQLMACAPFVTGNDLKSAADLMKTTDGSKAVIAIAPYPVPVEWAFRRERDGRLIPMEPGMFAMRSQDFEKKYFDTGTFVIYRAETVRIATGAGSDDHYVGYELEKGQAIDIDDEDDWRMAEAMFVLRSGTGAPVWTRTVGAQS